MSMGDSGAILTNKPKENVSDAGEDAPRIKVFPEGGQDQRCPRCKTVPNSMISMADGKWMCGVCGFPESDTRKEK